MFISAKEFKIIKRLNKIKSIDTKYLANQFSEFDGADLNETIESLREKKIIGRFAMWGWGEGQDHTSYSITKEGKAIAKNGYLKHNGIELFNLLNKYNGLLFGFITIVLSIIFFILSEK